MRFFEMVLSGAALISAALAVEFNSWPESVKAGETVTLTYSPKDAATTIILRKGPSGNLDTLDTLTTSSTGGSFEWTVPSTLANGDDYAFEIRQANADPNYSGQFSLSGGSAASSSASSSAGYSTAESSSASKTATSSAGYSTAVSTTVVTSASASASIVPSHGVNGTISTGSPSATASGSDSPSGTASPPVENTGAASAFGANPVALFMGAAAAFAYLV